MRELVRRCDALKAPSGVLPRAAARGTFDTSARVQELNRQKSGFASPVAARSIAAHIDWLDEQIEAVMDEARHLIAADPVLSKNLALVRSITGFGEVSATILLAELPNVEPKGSPGIAEFTPKALAAFVGLSLPAVFHRLCRRNLDDLRPVSTAPAPPYVGQGKSAASARNACAARMCALSAKRSNKPLAAFAARMTAAGKPPKLILSAVARKLLVYAHAVIRTQKAFDPSPDAPPPA